MPTAPLHVDIARHDAEHRLAGADNPRAVWPDHHCSMVALIAQKIALHPHHVLRGNAVGDRAYELNPRVRRLHDGVGAEGRRDEGDAMGRAGLLDGFLHGVENRKAEMLGAPLAGGDAADDFGAEGDHFLGVESTLVAGEALNQDPACFVD